jgi:hypothetical protein
MIYHLMAASNGEELFLKGVETLASAWAMGNSSTMKEMYCPF